MHMGAMHRAPLWILVLCALSSAAQGFFVRANCRGIQEFSVTDHSASCQESSVLAHDDHLLLGHTRAAVSLARGVLQSSAAGGQIRDVGANGGQAGALFMDRLTISGDWTGAIPVTVRLCVDYRFAGLGESRVHATLRTSPGGAALGANQAGIRLTNRGLGGAVLKSLDSRGDFEIPGEGARARASLLLLSVTENIHRRAPVLSVRADVAAFALPNLQALEPVLSSYSQVVAWVQLSLPEPLVFTSESGAFLSDAYAYEVMGDRQGSTLYSVIMTTRNNGKTHALRNHRDWHRASARSDCRHQLRLDG
jgi:hypothetical protein